MPRPCGCGPTPSGPSTDLPLVLYAEDLRVDGTGVLRYSFIFSNEDGGTATPALLARWGRTTDIEMAYEEEWKGGRMVTARYQAPDHHVIEYAATRQGEHPMLVDATLNNVFLDRGRTAVRITMVPTLVNLESATRESVMDRAPWVYRRMADELQEEGKTAVYGDVRQYLYVDAKLTLADARSRRSLVAKMAPGVRPTAGSRNWRLTAMAGSVSPSPARAVRPTSGSCAIRPSPPQDDAGSRSAACCRSMTGTSRDPIVVPERWTCRRGRCEALF